MSANVESCFVTRTPAWHGIGIVLPESPTAEDAIVAAGLDWEVQPKPIYINYGGGRQKVDNYFANTRMTDGSVLGVVTERYSIVQNSEAFQFVDGLLDEGLTYESAGSLRGGKQVWLLAKMPEMKVLDDKFEPYICFTNTHDGEGSVRVCLTPTRVVCQNTLNLALSTAKRAWSIRHIGDISTKLQEAQYTLGLTNKYNECLQTEAERLANLSVSDAVVEAMLDNIYPVKDTDSDIRKKRVADLKNNFFTCLAAPDLSNYKGTAYAVINAAADYADHSEPMRSTSNYKENRWGQVIVGHPFVDQMYKQIQKVG